MRTVLLILAATFSLGIPGATAGPTQRGILVLQTGDATRLWVQQLSDGFRDVVFASANPPVLYFEALDTFRFTDPAYVEQFRDWLRVKYRDRRIDLIVPFGEDGVEFLARRHGEPWPTVPVVYSEIGDISVDTRRDLPLATGVRVENHFQAALKLVTKILPGTRRIAMVSGASEMEQRYAAAYAENVRTANLGLEPLMVERSSLDAIAEQVSHLPNDAVLFILFPIADGSGRQMGPREACERLSAASNRPAIMLGRHDLGCGILGGMLRDMRTIGQITARQALARLDGPLPRIVDVPSSKFTTIAFDARQLGRWSIPESRLPAGSAIEFREPNLWRDHRTLVLSIVSALAIQTCLIASLIVEHRRRRRAEIDGRHHLAAMSHLDRRAVIGELTASLAHELNQPLGAILHNVEAARLLLAHGAPKLDIVREIVDDIEKDDKRAREVISRLRTLLRKRELETEPLDVNDVARETAALAAFDAASRGVRMIVDVPGAPNIVAGDRVHLQQALLNLVLNGMEAMVDVPEDRRRLTVRTAPNHDWVDVAVIDSGPGIPPDLALKIFEPFITTKGEGMGMGLSIARSIVEAHGGRIEAHTSDGGGATVQFTLPLDRERRSSVG